MNHRMTNHFNLPPFIHQQFFVSSPILQTCSALSHLFTVRTPASRPFVWGSIWTSLRELGKSATENSLQGDQVVNATVATIIYLVMRAIDGDGEGEGSDWEMLMIYEVSVSSPELFVIIFDHSFVNAEY